jgi:tRNA G18 (ribose-2'-O)-methylase SpoU
VRGYFGVGAERISKPMNLGAILRTAHAFGASFAFSIGAHHRARDMRLSDTAKSPAHMPFYEWAEIAEMRLPKGCVVVGVELDPDAVDLPSFRHPLNAAYLLGPERGELSPEARGRCAHLVRIPTKFSLNVSVAAALVMYDRALSLGGYPARPARSGGPPPGADWRAPPMRRRV